MSSNVQQNVFLINFSNNKRRNIENQKANSNIIFRKNSALEIFVFQYIPLIGASTILAPLNRLKVLLQVKDIIPMPKEVGSIGVGAKTNVSINGLVNGKGVV
jgi:hypothetical protein